MLLLDSDEPRAFLTVIAVPLEVRKLTQLAIDGKTFWSTLQPNGTPGTSAPLLSPLRVLPCLVVWEVWARDTYVNPTQRQTPTARKSITPPHERLTIVHLRRIARDHHLTSAIMYRTALHACQVPSR